MQQWRVVVRWPANNKFILERKIKGLPDVEPEVCGTGGAEYFVTVYVRADAAADEAETRKLAIERLTEILGETEARADQIQVDGLEATLVERGEEEAEAPALEREAPLEAEEVPLSESESGQDS
ncbi:hypothetical protein ACQI5H_23255 [Mycobacterium heidelbergense]|uniref:hypothetical protein n=1 Tax=Mycobacterium heidelbergense TaxID=53376 RepID=UPI003CE71618